MVLLPKQIDRLATLASETGAAIGVSHNGSSIIRVDTGKMQISIDADGFNVQPPQQEKLC